MSIRSDARGASIRSVVTVVVNTRANEVYDWITLGFCSILGIVIIRNVEKSDPAS